LTNFKSNKGYFRIRYGCPIHVTLFPADLQGDR
jgi:hypothetical protein